MDSICLIQKISTTFPPKKSSIFCEKTMSLLEFKKLLIKVIALYHPDKNQEHEYGMVWFKTTTEITKILNNRLILINNNK